MEVDFPTTREEFSKEMGDDSSGDDDDGRSSGRHTTPSNDGSEGFMAWPSRRSSMGADAEDHSVSDDCMKEYAITSNDGDHDTQTVGTVTVEFPSDRTPFLRRKSMDSYQSVESALSGYNAGGSRGSRDERSRGTRGTGDGIDDDSSTADIGSVGLKRRPSTASRGSADASAAARERRRPSLSSSVGSNTSPANNNGGRGGGPVRRRSKSIEQLRLSLDTIDSDQSFHRNSVRRNSGSVQSSGASLEQKLRRSMERKQNNMVQQPPPRRKSKEGLVRRPSLTQLHDENVMALPLLGWDNDIDDSISSSMHSMNKGRRSSFGPASIQPMPPGMKSSASHTGSMSSSLKASQYDSYEAVNALCEEFVPRGSFQQNDQGMPGSSSIGPLNESNNDQNNSNNRDLLMNMMQEEYDPRKPWRKAPAGAVEIQEQKKRSSSGNMNRRASGITMRSSFTSDMSFGDLMLQEMQQHASLSSSASAVLHAAIGDGHGLEQGDKDRPTETITAKSPTSTEEDMTAVAVVTNRSPHSDGDTLGENTFRASMCSKATSALSDNDDSSELTELRHAQEALFSVPESISTSQNDSESVTSSDIKEITVDNTAPTALSSSIRSGGGGSRSKDLSSLDIVQGEHQYHQDQQLSRSHSSQQQLAPVKEKDGSDGENTMEDDDIIAHVPRPSMVRRSSMDDEQRMMNWTIGDLDDLPSSSATKRPSGFGGKDDDSVSYSDIDMEPGHPHPSIKMCMTVRDSAIEREFATEQLTDVEFGETYTPNKSPHEGEMTLQDLLEGPSRNHIDDSYHPLPFNHDDSLRSGGNTNSSKKSSSKRTISTISDKKHFITKSVRKQTNKLDTKATKNLRRKNKRMWKFCVWNCRKITVCLILGLCLLVGIAALTWWGVAKVTGKDNDNGDGDGSTVQVETNIAVANDEGSSAAPTSPEGKQWPPTNDSGRIPPPLDGQLPSSSPSSRTSPDNLIAPIPVIELPPELPSFSSEVPVSVLDPEEQILSVAPSPASIFDVPSFSLSSGPLTSIEPTNDALQSPSSAPNSTANDTNTPLYSNNAELSPGEMVSSSINASDSQAPIANSSDAQLFPTSSPSPSSNASSYIQHSNNSGTIQTFPSVHPSASLSPSSSKSYNQAPIANSSDAQLFPTSSPSPSSNASSYIQHSNNSGTIQTFPSVHPSASLSPSSSESYNQVPLANSSDVQLFPTSSPSPSSNASFIQPPTVNTSDAQPYPSSSPSMSNPPSIIQTPTSNSSYVSSYPSASPFIIQTPTVNSGNVSSYPSLSPSISNNTANNIQIPLANSSITSVPPTASPSNNATYTSSNASSVEPLSGNSSIDSSFLLNQSSSISPIDVEYLYESIQAISGTKESEYAGASVSMSLTGEYIAVGFKEANGPVVEKTGLVRVYQRNSDNLYYPLGQDSMFGTSSGDEFGASVSISNDGNRVAVGSRSSSTTIDKQKNGETKVFEYSEASNSWFQVESSIQGLEGKDRLGYSVSLSGDGSRVAVGAPRGNGGTGSASVYEYNGVDWVLFGDVVVSDSIGDRAGFSVSLSNDGNTLGVGAFTSSTDDLNKCGSVLVYKLVGSTATDDSSSLVNQGPVLVGAIDDAQFGYSLSLSGDGTRLIVGSNGFGTANIIEKTGLCAVYEIQDENWIQIGALIGNEENEATGSHVSMSINGNVVSCSKSTSVNGTMIGVVTVLEESETKWHVADTIIPSVGDATSFGASVSLSQNGNTIISGAPSYSSSAGFFELFTRSG